MPIANLPLMHMIEWCMILSLLILLVFIFWKKRKKGIGNSSAQADENSSIFPFTPFNILNFDSTGNSLRDAWWNDLAEDNQFRLAMLLVQKAMPAWEKYTLGHDIYYRASPYGSIIHLHCNLIQNAIDEINSGRELVSSGSSHQKIILCHSEFVGHVIAMQDGIYAPPYPIKKIILAVYSIIKSSAEPFGSPDQRHFLSVSIQQSLDCIEITRLHDGQEMASFKEKFLNTV